MSLKRITPRDVMRRALRAYAGVPVPAAGARAAPHAKNRAQRRRDGRR